MPHHRNLSNFGKLLRVYMEKRNMSVVELAASSTLEDTYIIALQMDEEPAPSVSDVAKLIEGLSSYGVLTRGARNLFELVAQCERDRCAIPKEAMKRLERLYAASRVLNALAPARSYTDEALQ